MAVKNQTNDFGFGFNNFSNFEVDFDMNDFSFGAEMFGEKSGTNSRIMPPMMDGKNLCKAAAYDNAADFVRKLDIRPGFRQFAWVSGDFIFGDMLEALIAEREIVPRSVSICTLSLSPENIESLRIILQHTDIEELNMLISGFWYSHEKNEAVPMLYERLDIDNKFQVAFGNYHMKIIMLESVDGMKIVAHGSSNLRSSNSIEQVMIEDNAELYDFNYGFIKDVCKLYGTIDKSKKYRLGRNASWQVVRSQQ